MKHAPDDLLAQAACRFLTVIVLICSLDPMLNKRGAGLLSAQMRGGGGGGRRMDSSIGLMMPTEIPFGSSRMAYRAPQNASSGALWLRCPAAVTRACTRSTS